MSGIFRQDMHNRATVQAGEVIKEGMGLKFVNDGVLQVKKIAAVDDPCDAIALHDANEGINLSVQLAPGFCAVLLDADTARGTNLKYNADAEFLALVAADVVGTVTPCQTVADGKANDLCSAVFFGSGRVTLKIGQVNP